MPEVTREERLNQIKEREAKATKGPWTVKHELNVIAPDPRGGVRSPFSNSNLPHEERIANTEFAAHARADIPYLLEQLEKALSELSAAEKAARKEERELCCKDVCVACRTGARLIHTDAGSYTHEEGYCVAAAIRNRE